MTDVQCMKKCVLFDLGGTLVEYFERPEFPGILRLAIKEVQDFLRGKGLLQVSEEAMWQRVRDEDHEAADYRVRPMEERLARIFLLEHAANSDLLSAMCRVFMKTVFARARRYEDTLPVLQALKRKGFKTAIVSNTTWGSPAGLWREQAERLGLIEYVDALVFCRDAGWRKPAAPVFELALERLDARPQDCIFVGDDPRWDLVGPRAIGMEAILIDRKNVGAGNEETPIRGLDELPERLQP